MDKKLIFDQNDDKKNWHEVKLLILDVDGVLTDGKLYYGSEGESLKIFHVRDGQGIIQLLKNNVQVAIISGRDGKCTERRLTELGISKLCFNVQNKVDVYERLKNQLQIEEANTAYIGDDVGDIPLLKRVKFSITVPDAHDSVKKVATYITQLHGGNGAVREISDLILNV